MATEKQANAARDAVSDKLFALGAHAVGVDLVPKGRADAFGVIAYVTKDHTIALPKSVAVRSGKLIVDVPIFTKRSEPFQPE
jgi:hypothetical protein